MKFKLFYILVIGIISCTFSQQKSDLKKIDSLKELIFNTKELDSTVSAEANYKLAEYYRKTTTLTDSAFYYYHKAEKIFKKLNAKYELALTLYGIAVIQKNEKDFIGSEVTSIEALTLLESLNETEIIINL